MTKKIKIQNSAKQSNAVKTEAHDRGKKYEVAEEHRQSMIAELPKDKGCPLEKICTCHARGGGCCFHSATSFSLQMYSFSHP